MNKRIFFLLLLFLSLVTSIYLIKKLAKRNDPKIYLPDLQIKDENGNLINVSKFYGKPLVTNFWAT